MTVEKKQPQRRCTGCMQSFDKKLLVRVVRTADGEAALDTDGHTPGRGAYICKNPECFAKAVKGNRIERSLGVKISQEIYSVITEEIKRECE